MVGPAGFEPATWRLEVDVVRQAFAMIMFVHSDEFLEDDLCSIR